MPPASPRLKVIALISGGKDSFFSLLHCRRHQHDIVALANLLPPSNETDEYDLNSFMYQTVGHQVIPAYARALNLPLYRGVITGRAVQQGLTYDGSAAAAAAAAADDDETESLMHLLQRILRAHPDANAICSGAILSTYQRTRVESVAARLNLTSLAFLWQWPVVGGSDGAPSLLADMRQAGLQVRIVKVASGALGEEFLWADLLDADTVRRVQARMRRFGEGGKRNGAVLGEGGEYETLVVGGPRDLFSGGRLLVPEGERTVVREEGGVAWLRIGKVEVEVEVEGEGKGEGEGEGEGEVEDGCEGGSLGKNESGNFSGNFSESLGKSQSGISSGTVSGKPGGTSAGHSDTSLPTDIRIPDLWDEKFHQILSELADDSEIPIIPTSPSQDSTSTSPPNSPGLRRFTIIGNSASADMSEETQSVIKILAAELASHGQQAKDIISTMLLLGSMEDFTTVNEVCSSCTIKIQDSD